MNTNIKGNKQNLGAVSKNSQPFYAPPPYIQKTSAEIINEAKVAIKESMHMGENSFSMASVKPINTQRPFTPRDKQRILFGRKAKNSRPPSSFSLRYLQFENSECTAAPQTDAKFAKTARSNSIAELDNENIFNLNVKDVLIHKIKLPSLENTIKTKKKLFKASSSLDNLPEELEVNTEPVYTEIKRNAFSSPKERTDFDQIRSDTPFGHPSKQLQKKAESLILGPRHLDKIFENKQIVQDSESLFISKSLLPNNSSTKYQRNDDAETTHAELLVTDILYRLNNANGNEADEGILTLLEELYDCLEKNKLFGTKISSKLKIQILKCLYKLVESQNDKILIQVARIILELRVSGTNLSGVCKLVFKISRNDKNDHLFSTGNILELFVDALGRSSPLDDAEACVYGYGAIKFLTMNPVLLEKILGLGILELMVLHIKLINVTRKEKSAIPEQTNHALYQMTGALRNLASEDKMFNNFVDCGVVAELCQTMELFNSDIDIISNIARTLSIISTHDGCCTAISQFNHIYKTFVLLLEKYPGKEKIIVRLGYMMGNLVAKIDEARINLYNEEKFVESLTNILNIYLEKYLNSGLKKDGENEEKYDLDSSSDVIVKIVRIIANTAINPDIGRRLISTHGVNLIEIFLMVLFTKYDYNNEELILSVLSTLNNLSYYYKPENDKDAFHIKQIDLCKALCSYMECKNKDCVIESIRVLGNLSRSKTTRDYLIKNGYFKTLVDMLDKDDLELLRTTIGVFVNLMADNKNREFFKDSTGVMKLINALHLYGEYDWSLSMLICQVLWNYCIDSINLYEVFTGTEVEQLLSTLADYLDEEKLFGVSDSQDNTSLYSSQEYILWDEFANVATNLLEKIEYFLDNVDPIQVISYSDDEDLCIPHKTDSSTTIKYTQW